MTERTISTDEVLSLAERWVKRWMFDAGEADDVPCEACDGEAVPAEAIDAHDDVCPYEGHDVLDSGGGQCKTCGERLPPCPECGVYHGRQAPPLPLDHAERESLFGWVRRYIERVGATSETVLAAEVFDVLRWEPGGTEAEWWGGYENGKALARALCDSARA